MAISVVAENDRAVQVRVERVRIHYAQIDLAIRVGLDVLVNKSPLQRDVRLDAGVYSYDVAELGQRRAVAYEYRIAFVHHREDELNFKNQY